MGFASQPLDTYPEKHTVHCLYDPQVCRDSGYVVLREQEDGTFAVAYALDEMGMRSRGRF